MTEPLVVVTQTGAVQTLALNRPAALNSFTAELHAQLLAALEAARRVSHAHDDERKGQRPGHTMTPELQLDAMAGFAAPLSSASWSKAEMHFGMAKAAWKLAARNEHGAAMVIEHMERAIENLKAMTLNDHMSGGTSAPSPSSPTL